MHQAKRKRKPGCAKREGRQRGSERRKGSLAAVTLCPLDKSPTPPGGQSLTGLTTFRRGAVRRVGALLGSGHRAVRFACRGAGDKGSERWRPREKTTRMSGPGLTRWPAVCASRRWSSSARRAARTARVICAMRDVAGAGRGAAFRAAALHKREGSCRLCAAQERAKRLVTI